MKNTTTGGGVETTAVPTIEIVDVTKRYGETTALSNCTLDIEQGEFLVLLGPSGCGKSTLLKIIAGLEDATEGEVYIRGRLSNYTPPKDRDVAMVFQNYALYPHKRVRENIAFPLKMNRRPKREIETQVMQVAQLLGLEEMLDKYPEHLSGGQRQRVALGRAIIRNPVAFLMDEPLSNLDALLRVQMRDELLKLHRRVGRTTVYVTHDQVEAMTMADRIVVLRSGVIQQVGSPREVYEWPANTFVAVFVGSPQMNLYRGRIETAGGASFTAPGVSCLLGDRGWPLVDGQEVTLGIRPEDVAISSDGDAEALPGVVSLVEPLGSDVFINVELAEDVSCVVRLARSTKIVEGQSVRLTLSSDRIHLFGDDGTRLPLRPEVAASV
jgi:multiple sugar transport system ATP-binding protein